MKYCEISVKNLLKKVVFDRKDKAYPETTNKCKISKIHGLFFLNTSIKIHVGFA